jgi:hypothetical protein
MCSCINPFYESLTVRGKTLLAHFGGAAPPAQGTTFEKAAQTLQATGFTYDFVSDRQVRRARTDKGRITTEGGASYRVIVLPSSGYVPLETMVQILDLARNGATIVSLDGWPSDVTGLADLGGRRGRLKSALDAVGFGPADSNGVREAAIGSGRVLQGTDLGRLLARANVAREAMVDQGLQFARRIDAMGRIYFVSNPAERAIEAWVPIDSRAETLVAFDPLNGRHGRLNARAAGSTREIYVQIPAGGSLIVAESPTGVREAFDVFRPSAAAVPISGPWTVAFVKGGPRLPSRQTVARLASWITFDRDAEVFSGTAVYSVSFPRPTGTDRTWQIDLGRVADTARVRLNGRDVATLIGPPYQVVLDASALRATNTLEISVTNLSANRIRDLDVRGVNWKKFYNVNFPARLPDNRGPDGLFTAAKWEPLESGLLGPVTITPLSVVR